MNHLMNLLSTSGMMYLKKFLHQVWPTIFEALNGLADRILFFYQKAVERELEEMAQLCEALQAFSVKSLKVVPNTITTILGNTAYLQVPVRPFTKSQSRKRTLGHCKVQRLHVTRRKGDAAIPRVNSTSCALPSTCISSMTVWRRP